jgi:hypothetical protein
VLLALSVAVLANVEDVQSPPAVVTIFGHRWFWPWNFVSTPFYYVFNAFTGVVPPLDVDQLCYGVGVFSGCSGCELGTQNLCTFVSYINPNAPTARYFNCVPSDFAKALLLAEGIGYADELTTAGISDLRLESHLCPENAEEAPIIRASLSAGLAGSPLSWEFVSLIQNSFHDMAWTDVPRNKRPWAVDRTSIWSAAGLFGLGQFGAGVAVAGGLNAALGLVDCAALNDREQLLQLIGPAGPPGPPPNNVLNNLFIGVVSNPRSRWCANFIMGAYLSTRCPEYGRAVSGISYSLFLQFLLNCDPARGNTVAPALHSSTNPYAAFPYAVVPDNTPFALHDVPVMPNEEWEAWVTIQHVDENWDQSVPARVFGLPALPPD